MRKLFLSGLSGVALTLFFYLLIMYSGTRLGWKGVPLSNYFSDYYSVKGGDTYIRYHNFLRDNHYDGLVFGSSHAYRGYDPRIFESNGLSLYNLGSSGQSIRELYGIMRYYLSIADPGFVIIDIHPGMFESDGVESVSRLIANVPDHKLAAELAYRSKDWRPVNIFLNRVFNSRPPLLDSDERIDGVYISGGFVQKNDTISEEINYKNYGREFTPQAHQITAFQELLMYLDELKTQVFLVQHPRPKEISPYEEEQFSIYINSEIQKFPGIQFINYALIHPLSSREHFYDDNHLNQAGVTIFNSLLISELKKFKIRENN